MPITEVPSIRAFSIDEALSSEFCPYCGTQIDTAEHIDECMGAFVDFTNDVGSFVIHPTIGKVMVLDCRGGLSLIEGDCGRCVSPSKYLEDSKLGSLMETIDNAELNDNEILSIINTLRMKLSRFQTKLPKHPELPLGCRVELEAGNKTKAATIKGKHGHSYTATTDDGIELHVSNNGITKIL